MAGRDAGIRRTLGDDIDDAADRVRSIERRGSPAQDFDVIDLLFRDFGQILGAERGTRDRPSVDQNKGLVRRRAADSGGDRGPQFADRQRLETGGMQQRVPRIPRTEPVVVAWTDDLRTRGQLLGRERASV